VKLSGCGVQVSGTEMRKYMDDLLPIVMEMLQESSSLQKREVCLTLPL
jgi:FKBP12-rapamycin complex-associated protein